MSIAVSARTTDPHGPLAWATSLTVIGLQKVQVHASHGSFDVSETSDLEVDDDEVEAFESVATEFDLLAEAKQIPINDLFLGKNEPLRSALRDSFSTLVAIEKDASPLMNRIDFAKMGSELRGVLKSVRDQDFSRLNVDKLKELQAVCLNLLDHLDRQRPPISLH
jgi:hypothetical protein